MQKKAFLLGMVSCIFSMTVLADNIQVQVTAYSAVTNIPANFTGNNQFALLRPWEIDVAPHFAISSTPTTATLFVPAENTMPALELVDHVPPNNGLTWFYYCDGLTFQYHNGTDNNARVAFTGEINPTRPVGGVQCVCTGTACSTTQPVEAKLAIHA